MRDAVEFDIASRARQRDRAILGGDARQCVENLKKIVKARGLQEEVGDETGRLLKPTDKQGRKTHEADNFTNGNLAVKMEIASENEDSDHGDRRGHAA